MRVAPAASAHGLKQRDRGRVAHVLVGGGAESAGRSAADRAKRRRIVQVEPAASTPDRLADRRPALGGARERRAQQQDAEIGVAARRRQVADGFESARPTGSPARSAVRPRRARWRESRSAVMPCPGRSMHVARLGRLEFAGAQETSLIGPGPRCALASAVTSPATTSYRSGRGAAGRHVRRPAGLDDRSGDVEAG